MILVLTLLGSSGCALVDSGTPWESGPYKLHWIDDPDSVSLIQTSGMHHYTEVIPAQVFSVGIDSRYMVVKQHPSADKKITNYFIIDRSTEAQPRLSPSRIIGPLNADEFQLRSKQLTLPLFSKTLAGLE